MPYTSFYKNYVYKDMRLILSKIYKTFMKHRQAEFQIITLRNYFYKIAFG